MGRRGEREIFGWFLRSGFGGAFAQFGLVLPTFLDGLAVGLLRFCKKTDLSFSQGFFISI